MQATLTRSTITTPSIEDTTDYNTVSLLDKGKVERQRAVVRGDFIKDNLPKVGLEYTLETADYNLLKRKDDSRTYGVSVSHTAPSFKNINAGYYFTNGRGEMVTWEKDGALGVTHYYDKNGQEILLNPGKTWVCIIQTDRMDKAEYYGDTTQ